LVRWTGAGGEVSHPKPTGLITFLTDFGWGGGYVAACEATIARVSPQARVLHICHEVAVGDIRAGALVLSRVAPLCPAAVHLGVVDPGVGTSRRPVVLSAPRGDLLVGPDNGLLVAAVDALGGPDGAWVLDVGRVRTQAGLPPENVSNTFHGRDLFAPAAALLALGAEPGCLGDPTETTSLVRIGIAGEAVALEGVADEGVAASVVEVDRFGNVGLGLTFAQLSSAAEGAASFLVEVDGEAQPEWTVRVVRTYGDLLSGQLGLVEDSWGHAALALNGASAAEFLGVSPGVSVRLKPAHDSGARPAKNPGSVGGRRGAPERGKRERSSDL
jgi:S-adenosyl-L-methionine hydrolase (adenosine-forming)